MRIWTPLAEAEIEERQLRAMEASRSAWWQAEDYKQVVTDMRYRIDSLRKGLTYDEVVKANWSALRDLGGR